MSGTMLELTIPVPVSQILYALRFQTTPTILPGKQFLLPGVPFLSYFQSGELPTRPARHCLTGYSFCEPIPWESAPSLPQGSPVTAPTALQCRVRSAFPVPAWEPFKAGTKSFHLSLPCGSHHHSWGMTPTPSSLALGNQRYLTPQTALRGPILSHPLPCTPPYREDRVHSEEWTYNIPKANISNFPHLTPAQAHSTWSSGSTWLPG